MRSPKRAALVVFPPNEARRGTPGAGEAANSDRRECGVTPPKIRAVSDSHGLRTSDAPELSPRRGRNAARLGQS